MRTSRFGFNYKIRFNVDASLPTPAHDMTKAEAAELKRLETAFTDFAHRLGVHVTLELRFPKTGGEA